MRHFRSVTRLFWPSCIALIVLGYLLVWALNIAGSWALGQMLPTPVAQPGLFLPRAEYSLAPEPVERTLFLVNLLVVPPLLLGLVVTVRARKSRREPWPADLLEGLLSMGLSLLLILLLPTSMAMRASIGSAGLTLNGSLLHAALALAIAAFTILMTLHADRAGWGWTRSLMAKLRSAAVVLGLLCSGFGLIGFRLFGFNRLTGSTVWSDHLDTTVSAIARVKGGGTLLVNAQSQYGLYPELLAPLLNVLPQGLAGVTIAFAMVQILSLLGVLSVLRYRLHNAWVTFLGALALAMLTFGLHGVSGLRFSEFDPYFQYWPVRFAGPALSIPLVFWLFRNLGWLRLTLICGWTALCMFCNLDSGAAVLYAVSMLLVLISVIALVGKRRFGRWGWQTLISATLIFPVGSLLMLGMAVWGLTIKAQAPLRWEWLTSYQTTFYGLGFMMLPLPPWPDAWYALVAGYMMALLLGLVQLIEGHALGRILPLLYLPLLGAGLFTYYQGRSHFFNLVSVCWPMIPLTAILVDRQLLALRRGLVPVTTAGLPIAGLMFLLMPSMALIQSLPTLVRAVGQPLINKPDPKEPLATYINTELKMIDRYCSGIGDQCLLLCKRQGIYSLEVGLHTGLSGPSPAEMHLQSDFSKLLSEIQRGHHKQILLGIGSSSRLEHLNLWKLGLFGRYRIAAVNEHSTLILLRLKGQAY